MTDYQKSTAAPNVKQAVPFFGVIDMQQSLAFYVDGLNFRMTNKWIDDGKLRWCWLEIDSAAIMLQEFRKEGPNASSPGGKLGTGMSICFICEDALEIYRRALDRGLQPSEPFVGNNMWVTSLTDPNGYKIEFESYTDVPEDTTLSEYLAEKQ